MPLLADSHCHLDYPELASREDEVLDRARALGVRAFLTIGTELTKMDAVRAVAERHADVWFSVGQHPHHASDEAALPTEETLLAQASHPRAVAIGECGLDYYYDQSPRDEQQDVFRRHIRAALAAELPIIVHSREAEVDTIRILQEEGGGRLRGVFHCFSGSAALAAAGLELGFFISFSGIVTFRNADDLRAIARTIPADRLLVETDAPYLAPVPMRGKPNEPAHVVYTAGLLADLRGVTLEQLGAETTANFLRLFQRVSPPC